MLPPGIKGLTLICIVDLPVCLFSFNSFMTDFLSYRNQTIDLQSKSVDWFLYDRNLRHEELV